MATLEKIRKRSVLLFTVIIVALLAFILGDFLNNNRNWFGPSPAAKVNGQKVKYEDYYNKRGQVGNELGELARMQGQNDPDEGQLDAQVLQQMVGDALMADEYDELGLTASPEEISAEMGLGNRPFQMLTPEIQRFITFQCARLGMQPDAATLFNVVKNPAAYKVPADAAAQLKAAWTEAEKEAAKAVKNRKYNMLIASLFTANNVDARTIYDAVSQQYVVNYAGVDYTKIPDNQVKVTDQDIQAVYDRTKDRYRLVYDKEMVVDYIAVPVLPSAADMKAAEKKVAEGFATLQKGSNILPGFEVAQQTASLKQIQEVQDLAGMAAAIEGSQVGEVKTFAIPSQQYMRGLVRVDSVANKNSQAKVNILVSTDKAQADAAMKKVAAGGTFGSAGVKTTSDDKNMTIVADTVTMELVADNYVFNAPEIGGRIPVAADKVTAAPVGQYIQFTDSTGQQPLYYVLNVNSFNEPAPFYTFTQAIYQIEPSTATRDNLKNKLANYASKNKAAAKFEGNAAAAGYTVEKDVVVADITPGLGNIPGSRELVRNIVNTEAGNTTPVYNQTKGTQMYPFGYYAVALVKATYDDEYYPVDAPNVKAAITQQLLGEKKAAKVAEQYKGKAGSVASYAAAAGVAPADATVVLLGNQTNPQFNTPKLAGAVAAAKKGAVSKPTQGTSEVVVFTVKNVENSQEKFDAKQFGQMFSGGLMFDVTDALRQGEKVKTNTVPAK